MNEEDSMLKIQQQKQEIQKLKEELEYNKTRDQQIKMAQIANETVSKSREEFWNSVHNVKEQSVVQKALEKMQNDIIQYESAKSTIPPALSYY